MEKEVSDQSYIFLVVGYFETRADVPHLIFLLFGSLFQ